MHRPYPTSSIPSCCPGAGRLGTVLCLAWCLGLSPGQADDQALPLPGAGTPTYLAPDAALLASAERILYKRTPQEDLYLYLLRPPAAARSAPLPAIVYFTGGGWVNGRPQDTIANAAWFRDQGIIGIAADYRVFNRHQTSPLECVADAKSAIRYVRAHAAALGVDAQRIIAAGGSAGGHLAAATVLEGHDEAGEDLAVSSRPDGLVLHNPVLGAGFGEDWFRQHPDCSPLAGVRPGWPPTILSNGTRDGITPHAVAERFVQAMRASGNVCELISIPAAGHSCDWPASNPAFQPTLTRMTAFLRENALMPRTVPGP